MFRMWDVQDVGCWGCGMLGMSDAGDVRCWDVKCSECVIYKISCDISTIRGAYNPLYNPLHSINESSTTLLKY